MQNIVIWGSGPTGEEVYNSIVGKYNIVAFIDNNEQLDGTYKCGVRIVCAKQLLTLFTEYKIDKIVLGVGPQNYNEVFYQINQICLEFEEIYYAILIGKSDEIGRLVKYSNQDLGYLEFDVARNCNVNCKGCLRYSNITEEVEAMTMDSMEHDLQRLKELFHNIIYIKVLGGEPLLCKNLGERLRLIKKYFPHTQVDILSNGILIPKMDESLVKIVRELSVQISYTVYPPTLKMMDRIQEFLIGNQICYKQYGLDRELFLKGLNLHGNSNGDEVVKHCMSRNCSIIRNGIINRCCQPTYTYELNRKFGTKFEENVGIDIHDEKIDAHVILNFLREDTQFCRYCSTVESFRWSNDRSSVKLSDWCVEDKNEDN